MEVGLVSRIVFILWLFVMFVEQCDGGAAFTVNNEINLRENLLNISGIKTVRPERVTLIELSFNLLAVNKMDIKNEQFGVSGWWNMRWRDTRLAWNVGGFTGIPVIQVYSSDIWTPALVVDNSVNELSAINEDSIPLRIRQDGTVTWNPPGILTLSCEMAVTYFPFDTQNCSIQVTSFGYTIQEVNISVLSESGDGLTRTYYQENGEWDFIKTWYSRTEYKDGDYDYAKVAFHALLQRRAVYYGLNTVLPVLLNSLLIPMVFLLPHDAGEKIGYCLTVLLAYVVILTIVTDGLPTTAKSQSLLGVYIALVLTLAGIAVLLAIHSLYIFHRNPERPIPDWQARLTRSSLRIMRLKCAGERSRSVSPELDETAEEKRKRLNRVNTGKTPIHFYGKKDTGISSSNISAEVSDGEQEQMTWHLVAQAYDAFFLRVYFAIILSCSIGFLLAIAANQF